MTLKVTLQLIYYKINAMRYFTTILTTATLLAANSAMAQQDALSTEMLLPVTPALSPDGETLVFSWNHDLWSKSVDPEDTTPAKRLTFHPARETSPLFSPDGKTIYYNSNREGSTQIWAMNADGSGTSRQITIHSSTNSIEDISTDGKHIIYRSVRTATGRNPYRLFIQDIAGKTPEKMLVDASTKDGDLSPDGKKLLITREGADPYRKGYYGTQASQIWIYDIASKAFTQPVKDEHGVLSPFWSKDGTSFYYLSGKGGISNLWKHDLATSESKQLTTFTEDAVMFPSMSIDGSKIVFRKLFHYYIYDTSSGSIDKLTLRHNLDFAKKNKINYVLKKCNDADFSPSGLEIAFSGNGKLYAMDTVLREPKLLINTETYKRNIVFGDGGTAIYYINDDGIDTSIHKLSKENPGEYWWDTTDLVETSVITTQETIKSFEFSPDGKQIAYNTESGKLYVYNLKAKTEKIMASSWSSPYFDWSPDSKWLTYSLQDNNFNSDIYIAPIDGSEKPTNITKHPDNEFASKFSPDGKKLAFIGKRRGSSYDIYYVDLTPAGEEKSSRSKKIEMAKKAMKRDPIYRSTANKLKQAIKKLTPAKKTAPKASPKIKPEPSQSKPKQNNPKPKPAPKPNPATPTAPAKPTTQATQTKSDTKKTTAKKVDTLTKPKAKPDAKKPVKKASKAKKKYDLVDVQKRIVRLTAKGTTPSTLFWRSDSKAILFSGDSTGSATYALDIRSKKASKAINATGYPIRYDKNGTLYWISGDLPSVVKGGSSSSYSFSVQTNSDKEGYSKYVYRLIWRTMRDGFYDVEMNGKNWSAIRKKYESAAANAQSKEDFDRVINLLLGELNASHCGYRSSSSSTWQPRKAWSESMRHLGVSYEAKPNGWHITKVFPEGPASRVISKLSEGDIITEIDGKPVTDSTVQHTVLWGQMKDALQLKVTNAEGDKREVALAPISYAQARALNSASLIDYNKKMVEKLSKGKLGYIHISRMMWDEFEKFEQHLYENGAGKDGIIIDVRDNGGGFTTDHLLTALTQPRHAFTIPRHGGRGYPQDRFVYATWNRPIVVLCNQNSFSNAEIFSHAIRTLDRGKVVGVASTGGVISAGSKKILKSGSLRMPFRGWFNIKTGEDMELNGAAPHFVVWPEPGELSAGIDKQLNKAVEVLTDEVKQDKAKRQIVKPIYRNRK